MRRSAINTSNTYPSDACDTQFSGLESFQSMILGLDQLVLNRQQHPELRFSLPTYLIAAEEGCSPLPCVDFLAEYLKAHNLLRFSGLHDWFGWKLSEEADWSIDRLLDKLDEEAGFSCGYRGVVALDIDGLGERNCDMLSDLVQLTRDTRGEILFIYLTRLKGEQRLHDLLRALSPTAPLELLRLQLPTETQMTTYVTDHLNAAGFTVSDEARAELPRLVGLMRKINGFGGSSSLDRLAEAIAYHAATSRVMDRRPEIQAVDLTYFMAENSCALPMARSSEHRSIGFGG